MKRNIFIHTIFAISLQSISYCLSAAEFSTYRELFCQIEPAKRSPKSGSHPYISATRGSSAQLTSTNWAGYVAATNLQNPLSGSVTSVTGFWRIPPITPTRNIDTYSAFWVGIGGFQSSDGNLLQAGTSHDCINGKAQYYAWFEAYPQPSYQITGFPVAKGDSISTTVTYIKNNIFELTVYNHTKQVRYTVPHSYTTVANALRMTAEWVAEAPWLNGILALTNFGTAAFTQCSATINGTTAPLKNNKWQSASINMITEAGSLQAQTSPIGADKSSFSVAFKKSQ